jgi:hypothetical protein
MKIKMWSTAKAGFGGVGIGEVGGGINIKLATAYGAKAQLICDRCVVHKLGFELSFNAVTNGLGTGVVASLVYTGVAKC